MTAPHRRAASLLAAATLLLVLPADAFSQLGKLREAAGKALEKTPSVSSLLEGEPPITTSLEDAVWGQPSMDDFEPDVEARPLTELERTETGAFVLAPGFWEMHTQSYCLKAGTHGPGGGDGYLYAPPLGPAEAAVVAILRNSYRHPDVPQHDIQILLWAIIARAKFEDLSPQVKATAARLLDAETIATLNRTALDLVPDAVLQKALAESPPLVRQILQAEAQLRQMLVDANYTYAQLEEVAVLTGMAEPGPGSREVPSGRWSEHPDGYDIRYLPQGYSHTVVQIWVPEDAEGIGKAFDPTLHIAVPGNTARQRLIQSARPQAGHAS